MTTKYYALAVTISQMVLEVGADMDIIKSKTMVGVSVVVVVVIVISVLLCWCCCNVETDSSNNDINRQDVRTPLIDPRPQPPQRISSQTLTDGRAVIKQVEKSGTVVSFQQDSPDADHLLQKHRAFLRDRMDVDFGLLDVLLGSEILSYETLQRIRSRSPFQERNETLIDYIMQHNCYQGLSPALEDTHQGHIVNFLEADGVYRKTFEGVWPLSETIVRAMDSNRHSLLDLIDSTELVNELFAKSVISRRHREAISSKSASYERNETLLDILRRISIQGYSKAMMCFHATKQSHIVQALAEGGRIVRVYANLQGVEEVFRTEKELVDKITYLLRNETTSYADYLLQLVQLRLIGVTVGHSVVCHFHCPAADDLKSLKDKLRSRELEKSLDTVFTAALPERHIAGVAITSVDKQYADRTVPSSDSSVGSLDRGVSRSVYAADDIETTELYSILEKDLPVQHRAWKSRRPSKKY